MCNSLLKGCSLPQLNKNYCYCEGYHICFLPYTPCSVAIHSFTTIYVCIPPSPPHQQKNVHSDKFLVYMCKQVLPNLSEVTTPDEPEAKEEEKGEKKKEKENGATATAAAASTDGAPPKADTQLEILKLLAEMSTYCGPMENLEECLGKIFDRLSVSTLAFVNCVEIATLEVSMIPIYNR